jgi:hypothetical protein
MPDCERAGFVDMAALSINGKIDVRTSSSRCG